MNTAYLKEKVLLIIERQPNVLLCLGRAGSNETVVERLIAMGHEVETLERYTSFPNCPIEPKIENFSST